MSKCTINECPNKKFSGTCMATNGESCVHNTAYIANQNRKHDVKTMCTGCSHACEGAGACQYISLCAQLALGR